MQLGNLNLLILKSISKSEKYGLEIIDDISQETNGQVIVKQPSLYSGLRRLEQRGLITSRWEDSDIGGRRHYYSITNLGKTELAAHTSNDANAENAAPAPKVEEPAQADVTPNEIPTENIFASSNDQIQSEDEKTVSELEQSVFDDEQPAGYTQQNYFDQVEAQEEKKEETASEFSEYQPELDADDTKRKTFSDKMRDYVEPENNYDEYKMQEDKPAQEDVVADEQVVEPENKNAESDIIENAQKVVNSYSEPQDTVVEYVRAKETSNDEINYKDLLGDLDADLNNNEEENKDQPAEEQTINLEDVENASITAPQQDQEQTVNEAPRQKSAYEKELEQILLSSKTDDATHNLTIKETDRMAEVNRRYGDGTVSINPDEVVEDETFDENIHKISSKDVGFTYLNQDDITVKPYKKANKKAANTGLFLNVNKYNLVRASIMFVLMALELAALYFIGKSCGLFSGIGTTTVVLFSVSISIVALYYLITLIYTIPNFSKKIKIETISFAKDFLYRFIMFAFVVLFVFGLNIFMGMPNTASWLIPCVLTSNILISWIVGIIAYHTKAFHA